MSDDAMVLTQRKLLMEMREDIKGLKATVDVIAKDQALGAEGGVTERGDIAGRVRKTGRGERIEPVTIPIGGWVTPPSGFRLVREDSA